MDRNRNKLNPLHLKTFANSVDINDLYSASSSGGPNDNPASLNQLHAIGGASLVQ